MLEVVQTTVVPLASRLAALEASELASAVRKVKLLKQIAGCNEVKAIETEAKLRLERDPNSLPGYALKSMGSVRNISDAMKAFDMLNNGGIPADGLYEIMEMSPTKAEGLLTGVKKKDRKATLKTLLGDLLTETPKEKSLICVSEAEMDAING